MCHHLEDESGLLEGAVAMMGLWICYHAEPGPCGVGLKGASLEAVIHPTRIWCGFPQSVAGMAKFQISQLQWAGVEAPLSLEISVFSLRLHLPVSHQGGDEEIFCSLLSVSSLCTGVRDLRCGSEL